MLPPNKQQAGFDPADVEQVGIGYGGLNLDNPPAPKEAFFYACGYNDGTNLYGGRFQFPDPDPLVLELGKVVQWNFVDIDFHPLHTHINPFQIAALNASWLFPQSRFTSYFEVRERGAARGGGGGGRGLFKGERRGGSGTETHNTHTKDTS